ncbi:MAG: DJ-1/PfpI family protein [Actinomycetota bacterium]|nr:DJ-1/PfpI family protein [Actinomycetota bacterium]
MNIDIVVFDGVDEVDAIGPFEVFSNASFAVKDLQTRLVTLGEPSEIVGSSGLRFQPHGVWRPGEAEILVVPGGGWGTKSSVGIYGEVQRGQWNEPLLAARKTTSLIAGVCTGTLLLAAAGLLAGRRAITHKSAIEDLRNFGVEIVEEKVVDDGDLVTCGGVTSGFDLAYWIVEREFGERLANGIAGAMEYQRTKPTIQ